MCDAYFYIFKKADNSGPVIFHSNKIQPTNREIGFYLHWLTPFELLRTYKVVWYNLDKEQWYESMVHSKYKFMMESTIKNYYLEDDEFVDVYASAPTYEDTTVLKLLSSDWPVTRVNYNG